MNRWCLSAFLVSLLVVVVLGAPKKSFEDNLKILRKVDVDSLIKSDRLIKSYITCVTKGRPCNAEGNALKESWKEGLDKGCDQCEEEEKKKVKKIVKHVYLNRRNWYDELVDSLDKDKKYTDKYQKYIDEIINDPSL